MVTSAVANLQLYLFPLYCCNLCQSVGNASMLKHTFRSKRVFPKFSRLMANQLLFFRHAEICLFSPTFKEYNRVFRQLW